MAVNSASDMQAVTRRIRHNCSWAVGVQVVRCVFNVRTQTIRFEMDGFMVPPESVDALLLKHPNQRPEPFPRGSR